jgi:hypothetical protein
MFYSMNVKPEWKDVFPPSGKQGLDEFFVNLGKEFLSFYERLQGMPEIRFHLSASQQKRFNVFFRDIHEKYFALQGLDYVATIRRLGLIAFRIAMVLTALRLTEEGHTEEEMECGERDFEIALMMIQVLVKHASKVFSQLPEEVRPAPRKNTKEKLLDALPAEFTRKVYHEVAKKMGLNFRTADRYVSSFVKSGLVHRERQDLYQKPNTLANPLPVDETQAKEIAKDAQKEETA